MISEVPSVASNGKYNTTETAKLLGITRTTLNKYVEMKYIKFVIRKSNKRKYFKGSEILRFWNAEMI